MAADGFFDACCISTTSLQVMRGCRSVIETAVVTTLAGKVTPTDTKAAQTTASNEKLVAHEHLYDVVAIHLLFPSSTREASQKKRAKCECSLNEMRNFKSSQKLLPAWSISAYHCIMNFSVQNSFQWIVADVCLCP